MGDSHEEICALRHADLKEGIRETKRMFWWIMTFLVLTLGSVCMTLGAVLIKGNM